MSDEWRFFMCSMGDHLASIMVNVGISGNIGKTPPTLASVRVTYKQPNDNGLPTDAEFDAVSALEEQLEAFVKFGRDAYVGRITSQGARTFFIYTKRDESRWDKFVEQLAGSTGYSLGLQVEEDPEHTHYWKYLYPTPDDWQVIRDMELCEALEKHGDDLDAERKIDHWAYFPNAKAAQPFIDWAVKDRFAHDAEYSGAGENGEYCVRLHHFGTARQREVSRHTIALRQKAEQFGGKYDGWETPVVRAGEKNA